MSTEGSPESTPVPRTRAEARALRDAAEAAAAETAAQEVAAQIPLAPEPVAGIGAVPLPLVEEQAQPAEGYRRRDAAADAAAADPQTNRPPAASPRRTAARPRGRFALALAVVVAVLALIGGGLAYVSLTQGPRLTSVQVDPAEAIALSGSRVILSSNQPLEPIDPSQVTVSPEIPFTVDASGRNVGVRFTVPLDDSTEYTVTVAGATGIGGGPASDLSTTFTTPSSQAYLLLRGGASDGADAIVRVDLAGDAVTVFTHDRINDFREAGDALVVAVEEGESTRVLVVGKDGEERHELALPGDGFVSAVQVSDRGGLVGFVYTDRDLTELSGRASVLVTQPLSGHGEPTIVEAAGEEASIAQWQFVPDTASVLFIDFSGTLFVADRSGSGESMPLGLALSIQGIERGTYTAVIERSDGTLFRLNLADGEESEFPVSDPYYGPPVAIAVFPGGTTQHIIARDEYGMPTGQAIVRVDDDGAALPLLEVGERDSILQACPSPSGQYLAIAVAPDLLNNPYDDMLFALPERVETHLFDLRTGEPMLAITGVNISWCAFASEL